MMRVQRDATKTTAEQTSNDASTRKQTSIFKAVAVRVARRRCCRSGEEGTMMTTLNNNYDND
jgi:hypothetical protein